MKWDLYGEQIEYKEIEQMLAEDQNHQFSRDHRR